MAYTNDVDERKHGLLNIVQNVECVKKIRAALRDRKFFVSYLVQSTVEKN
jgi:hypothetical protein